MKFYRCNICGKVIINLKPNGNVVNCCGTNMEELIAIGMLDPKHTPVLEINNIKIGSILHPMVGAHYIDFVVVELDDGFLFKSFELDEEPILHIDDKIVLSIKNIYAYCNLHGLYVISLGNK